MVIMLFGWLFGSLLVSPSKINNQELLNEIALDDKGLKEEGNWNKDRLIRSFLRLYNELKDWRVFTLIPIFFNANVFYLYQQSVVNSNTFNIRTRSLNSALYWLAQMFGGIVMGAILDLTPTNRRNRGIIGWVFLFVTAMVIWGGGYQFEKWLENRNDLGLLQDIDYTDGSIYLGPMFLYMLYGAYDSFWQSFCYWLMGAITNSAYASGILVGL